jgi:hypothetical protein
VGSTHPKDRRILALPKKLVQEVAATLPIIMKLERIPARRPRS